MIPNTFYHIYNRGNNREQIFYSRSHYLYFLQKINRFIKPHCHILAWCLMPNHFHFLVYTNHKGIELLKKQQQSISKLMEGFRNLLSTYTQGFNQEQQRTGSLFTQNTKVKLLETNLNQPFICFHYIHQNPLKAGLVSKLEDWEYSSFLDYAEMRNGKLCDKALAHDILPISYDNFYNQSCEVIDKQLLNGLYA